MSSNNNTSLLILFSLLLLLILDFADLTFSSSCLRNCGGIDIPYPFGIGKDCYLDKWYEIKCFNSSVLGNLVPFLAVISKEVVNISLPSQFEDTKPLPYGTVLIKNPIMSTGCTGNEEEHLTFLNLKGTPFYVGYSNTLIGIGCKNTVSLTNVEPSMVGCMSSCSTANQTSLEDYSTTINCNTKALMTDHDCNASCNNGIGCCKASMPNGVHQVVTITGGCKVAFITTQSNYLLNRPQELHATGHSTIELGWFIRKTNLSFIDSLGCQNIAEYRKTKYLLPRRSCVCDSNDNLRYANCACTLGYRGNPYLLAGCKDVDECREKDPDRSPICGKGKNCVNWNGYYECLYPKSLLTVIGISVVFGSLIFVIGIFGSCKLFRRQRKLNKKKKFFKRNGGLLLQQQLNSTTGNIEKTRVFSSRELEKATEKFSFSRVLGEGGQGTVYKGMLVDGRIVAVKKSKAVDEDKLEEFINEVVILSQINHRNIVKLLGCCLETDVPVLVYEYISNGNLFEHLHDEFDDYTMSTWEMRLRIAVDISGALAYLHSAASSPIYHRDVKSTNIMLDEKYRAKISDFGTSRSVTVDHTHLTTVVSGTVGYMDPEYFQSSQYTDKSDVYSFGVVLVELITGEKSFSVLRSKENKTLATFFILAMKENKLFEIIDARIKDKCKLDQVAAAANIAKRCLNLKGKKRPTMREVSMELEWIRSSFGDVQRNVYLSEKEEEEAVKIINIKAESSKGVVLTDPAPQYDIVDVSSSSWPDGTIFSSLTR